MKQIILFIIFLVSCSAVIAQPVYNVSVCGHIAWQEGMPGIDLSYTVGGQTQQLSTLNSPLNGFCFNFTVNADSGIYAITDIVLTQNGCQLPGTISRANLLITSDTAITLDFRNCYNPETCHIAAQVNPLANCPAVYAPVCGCNDTTYANSCEAYYAGVFEWREGSCGITCYTTIRQDTTVQGDPRLIATPSGPGPYTYTWTTENGLSLANNDSVIPYQVSDLYFVSVSDGNGCVSDTSYYYGTDMTCFITIEEEVDPLTNADMFVVNNITGSSPFTYTWSFNNVIWWDDDGVIYPHDIGNGQYVVYVTDARGCTSEAILSYEDVCFSGFALWSNNDLHGYSYGPYPQTNTWYFNGQQLPDTGEVIFPDQAGEYCVEVIDGDGCVSSICYSYGIGGNCNTYMIIHPDYSVQPQPGVTAAFESHTFGTPPYTYLWSFSDGETSDLANPVHIFSTNGGGAELEVWDSTGCYSYTVVHFFPEDTTWVQQCYASYSLYLDDMSGISGQVYFEDNSYSGSPITSWLWDFGNGNTSTLQNPTFVYTAEGVYTACLTITTDTGCTNTYCGAFYVNPDWWINNPGGPPVDDCYAAFFPLQDSGTTGQVILADLSYGYNLAYYWDFGNGSVSYDQYPQLSISNNGWLYICLTVTDAIDGCTDTYCDSVGVDENGILRGGGGNIDWSVYALPAVHVPLSYLAVEEEEVQKVSATLYPNPVADQLTLQLTAEGRHKVSVELLDVTGKLVSTTVVQVNKGVNTHTIATDNLAGGMYFLKLGAGGINETLRFVKMK